MTKEELYAHPGWRWCSSDGAELHTLLLGLQTSFREKLEWLEEAETLTLRLRAQRESHPIANSIHSPKYAPPPRDR
jgi:hypothetical protein